MSVGAVNKQTGDRIPTAGMPAIDDALDLTSVNPVQNTVITAALALKQDKTDNSLQTTDKTVVGAINEHEGDIDSLKSGLTNVRDDVKLNTQDLTTGSRTQNIAPITLSVIKANNTDGTWANNVYTLNDVTFTVSTDSNGNVDGITVNGTASDTTVLTLYELPSFFTVGKQYVVSGCYSGGSAETYKHDLLRSDAVLTTEYGSGATVTANSTYVNTNVRERIVVYNGVSLTNAVFLPMVRLASTSATFAPYIPSVESRIEAVESGLDTVKSGLTNVSDGVAITGLTLDQNVDGTIDDVKVFRFGKLIVGNIRVTLNATVSGGSPILHGLPIINTALAAFNGFCPVTTNKIDVACTIFNELANEASLGVATGVTAGTGVLMLSFSYVSA